MSAQKIDTEQDSYWPLCLISIGVIWFLNAMWNEQHHLPAAIFFTCLFGGLVLWMHKWFWFPQPENADDMYPPAQQHSQETLNDRNMLHQALEMNVRRELEVVHRAPKG